MKPAERILAACGRMLAKGYRVKPGAWGVAWNPKRKRWAPLKRNQRCLCPLGALVLVEQPKPGRYCSVPEAAVALLGVDVPWVMDFQMAFDGILTACLVDLDSEGETAAVKVARALASSAPQ